MDAFLEAAEQAGHPGNPDFNGPEQDGVGYYQLTQRDGMRCSAAVAYLHPALQRPNLTVITDALCTRILFEGDRAGGVEIERGNQLSELRADREVIVSAGAYNSAQLLMEGRGPLTSNIGEAGGFFRTLDGLAGPEFQFHAAPVMFVDEGLALL